MKSTILKIKLIGSKIVAWIATIITIVVAIKYEYIFGRFCISSYFDYIVRFDGLIYLMLLSLIIVVVITIIYIMGITIYHPLVFTDEYFRKHDKEFGKNVEQLKIIESKNKTRDQFNKLSEIEQCRVVKEMYDADVNKRVIAKYKVIQQQQEEKFRREEEIAFNKQRKEEQNREAIRRSKLTPEQKYWEDKEIVEQNEREQQEYYRYEQERQNEDEQRKNRERQREQDLYNKEMLAEAKKANRTPMEKFDDLPFYEKATYIIGGNILYNKLKK